MNVNNLKIVEYNLIYDDLFSNPDHNLNIFNSHLWLKTWLSTYEQKNWQLKIYAVYHKEKLVSLAPFYIQKNTKWSQPTILYPLGQGEPEKSEIASEYSDLYITKGYEEGVIQLLVKKLEELNIDQIQWRASLKSSHINRLLKAAFSYQTEVTHSRYFIERPTWSLDNLSKNTRSRYKRSINQLNKINASFKWVDKNDYDTFFQILAQLHQTRWLNKGKAGVFSEHDFKKFHKNYRHANPNNIRISAIILNSKPIAINYYLADKSTLYFYQCGWDETNYANYSLGMALHLWSIQHCSHQYYDFMMGKKQDSYKAKFGTEQQPMHNITITFSPIKLMIYRALKKIKLIK